MKKKINRITESALNRIVKSAVNKVLRESVSNEALNTNDILALANIVVKKYGNGNCIDLDNPQELVNSVQYVMRTERCDEYEALVYMSGAKGGGWG